MNFNLRETAKDHVLIVAHRGVCGGNIPCNTLTAYRNAVAQGADMIEIDVTKSRDGKLYIFHPGMERAHLDKQINIKNMDSEEIDKLRYVTYDRIETQFKINTLDEVFEEFKGKCYINVDKFWDNPKEISETIKRHNIKEQVLVKSGYSENVVKVLSEFGKDIPFLIIARKDHKYHDLLKNSDINYVGAEVLFDNENDSVCSEDFINMMHKDGKLVWVNSIIYNYKEQLAAGHCDDLAADGDMDNSFGWLIKRGFDFIQTDYTGLLKDYISKISNK